MNTDIDTSNDSIHGSKQLPRGYLLRHEAPRVKQKQQQQQQQQLLSTPRVCTSRASSRKRKCHYLEKHPYHWMGIEVSVVAVSYSTGLLSTSTITERTRHPTLVRLAARNTHPPYVSGGGMIRLETLIELKFLNSSFSNLNFSMRAFRAFPLIEIRQTVPCRAIRGKPSDLRQRYLSQQHSPSLLMLTAAGYLLLL